MTTEEQLKHVRWQIKYYEDQVAASLVNISAYKREEEALVQEQTNSNHNTNERNLVK